VKFENTFSVDAPIDEVYAALLDVERVAPCVPGAEVLEQTGDDAYAVAIKVKVGPISMTYRGNVEIIERDEAAHRAVMRARAREMRGQGTADARVQMSLTENGSTTNGTMVADVQLAGRAAAMGRGVIQDVSGKIVATFAQNLEAMLSGAPAPAAAGAPAAEPQAAAAQPQAAATEPEPQAAATEPEPQATGPEAPPGPEATGAEAGGGPEAAAAAAAAGETEAAAPKAPPPPAAPPPPRPVPAPAEESTLPIGQIVGSVLLGRLRDPKVLGGLAAVGAAVLAVLRRRNR
jgi:carbon monoxide dehydrogenase subunit G